MIIVLVKNLQKNHHGCWIVSLELDHFFFYGVRHGIFGLLERRFQRRD
jgi:hypothetical protein